MPLRYLLLVTLFGAMACVVYYDGRWRRIPNFITLPLMVIGILAQIFMRGWPGFYLSLLGILAGAGLLLPVYLLRGLGGGDIKLMAAIGACVGLRLIGAVLFLTALSGGVLALLWIILQRSHLQWHPLPPMAQQPLTATLPYGWAIVSGTVLAIYILPLEVWL
jgi:Flp pilus assembly protein protease CpaA